jgi:hypothetical protein
VGVRFHKASLAAAACVGVAAGAVGPACTCSTPSSNVDGGDLLGVFDHDAGADGSVDSGAKRGKRRKDGGPGASSSVARPAPASSVRPPVEGVCVAPAGEADHDIHRTMGRPPCRGAQVVEW